MDSEPKASPVSVQMQADKALRESRSWLAGQKEAFQYAINGRPLAECLGVLVRLVVEHTNGEARAAFFVTQPSGAGLEHVVGMGEDYAKAIYGFAVGPGSLACGLAIHSSEPVITPDVETDPRWEPWRHMARRFNYRGCWSFPVRIDGGPSLGSFAMYFVTPRHPTPRELELAGVVANAAAIIISRDNEATERVEARNALRQSEAELRAVTDLVPEMLWQVDAAGQPLWHNRRWVEYTGQSIDDAKNGGWMRQIHPEDREETTRSFGECIATGKPWRREHRIANRAGEYRWFLVQAMPQRDAAGHITSWFGSVTDIHDQQTAVVEISESEGQLKSVMESALDFAILLMDEKGVITRWNAGATQLLGWTEAEATGQSAAIIFTEEDRANGAPQQEEQMALRDGRAPDERWHVRKDGSRFWGSGVMSVVRDENGQHRGFVKVLRDTTARRQNDVDRARLLEAEQYARAQAEAANAAKDQFLANASHELRTPLAAILLWTNLLKTGDGDKQLQAEAVHVIEHSAKAQQKLIEDLLDSARIATGKLAIELKPADLRAAVRDAVAIVRPAADAKDVELVMSLGHDIGHVMIDADRLQQVVWNLVSNAVKFTPSGGRIDIDLTRQGETVEIRVADTGQGISAEDLPHIFTRFRQGDASITRRQSGLGLGLAISRQLVELHGGSIHAASNGLGQGSTFTLRLPLPRQRPGQSKPLRSQRDGGLANAQLMLIEDDDSTREVLAVLLRRAGAGIDAFAHADAAKEAFLAERPDLILSDIGLPDKDGYTLIRELRAAESPDGPRVPAVALSAFDRPSDQKRALAAGFDAYLTKPVETARLLEVIRQLLGR